MASVKHALLRATLATGGFAPFRLASGRNGLVLMYHRFGEQQGGGAVSSQQFAAHLRYLTERYTIVSVPALAAHLSNGRNLARPMAAITIDDGHADAFDVAFPVLKRFRVPATLFVVTGFLDGACWLWTDRVRYLFAQTSRTQVGLAMGTELLDLELDGPSARLAAATCVAQRLKRMPDESKNRALEVLAAALDVDVPVRPPPGYAPVTWAQVRELEGNGVAVEPHTVSHPILTNVANDQLIYELTQSKARLEEELGRVATVFCYPNGAWNPTVRDSVKRAGYTCAVLSSSGLNAPGVDPFCLQRFGAEGDLARFVKTTSGFDSWQMSLWRPGTRSE